jgi:hypothetical protein
MENLDHRRCVPQGRSGTVAHPAHDDLTRLRITLPRTRRKTFGNSPFHLTGKTFRAVDQLAGPHVSSKSTLVWSPGTDARFATWGPSRIPVAFNIRIDAITANREGFVSQDHLSVEETAWKTRRHVAEAGRARDPMRRETDDEKSDDRAGVNEPAEDATGQPSLRDCDAYFRRFPAVRRRRRKRRALRPALTRLAHRRQTYSL